MRDVSSSIQPALISAVPVANVAGSADVGMIQAGNGASFALEAFTRLAPIPDRDTRKALFAAARSLDDRTAECRQQPFAPAEILLTWPEPRCSGRGCQAGEDRSSLGRFSTTLWRGESNPRPKFG